MEKAKEYTYTINVREWVPADFDNPRTRVIEDIDGALTVYVANMDVEVSDPKEILVEDGFFDGWAFPPKLAMADIQSDDNIHLRVSDLIRISAVPEAIRKFIADYTGMGIHKLDCGLPASGFIGERGCKIVGLFDYGEVGFIAYYGRDEDILSSELIHLFSRVSESEYEQMKLDTENFIADWEAEHANGEED